MINYNNIIENDFEKPIYESLHGKILDYLKLDDNCSFWNIINNVGGSERRTIRLLFEMEKNKEIIIVNDKISLKNTKNKNNLISTCPTCKGITCVHSKLLLSLKDKFNEIYNQKPKPSFIFDQRPVNVETTFNRVSYMINKGDLVGKNVVFLGDDDLTGLLTALTNVASRVVILDIDERLINFINDIKVKYNLNCEAYVFDATKQLPNELVGKFNTLLCDPTPEPIPFAIFLNTAINLTEANSTIYTSIYSTAMSLDINMQRVITDRNLLITDMLSKWTKYSSIYKLYRQSDIDLFNKYNINLENGICFTETFIRTIKTSDTKTLSVNFKEEDLFGKATKRVIKDAKNDVEIEDDKYLNNVLENIKGKKKNG